MQKLDQAKKMADVLQKALREKSVKLAFGNCLDIVARQLGSRNWDTLVASSKRADPPALHSKQPTKSGLQVVRPTDFSFVFPELNMLKCNLDDGIVTQHPFPRQLEDIPELGRWKNAWPSPALSTKTAPFFPPAFSPADLISDKATFEVRRDWKINSSGKAVPTKLYHFSQGTCCVLARNEKRDLLGASSWRWWGQRDVIDGVEYGLHLLTLSGWLFVTFDLRAQRSQVSAGPIIVRSDDGKNAEMIRRDLQRLSKLKVFQYQH